MIQAAPSPICERRKGFTLVEAIIVVVVIVALLAILIPWMREQERERLQALADSEPWEVFEFRAAPAKESFSEDEDIVIECEIVNLTDYRLTLPADLRAFAITLGDTDSVAGFEKETSLVNPETAIAAGESLSVELRFRPLRVGTARVRVDYSNGAMVTNILIFPSELGERQVALNILEPIAGSYRRFRSNSFQLVVEASDDSELPPFDIRKLFAQIE